MPPSLMVLLCLGLSMGLRTPVQAGTLPKPTLWAEPSSVIPWGSSVTVWCQGILKAQEFHLGKEGSPPSWNTEKPLGPGNKAKFSITQMTEHAAGRYHCFYVSQGDWSEHSDPLELAATGAYSTPSLSAWPSPVMTSGGNVTLKCHSDEGFGVFVLIMEGEDRLSWTLDSQRDPSGQVQALFPVGPVIPRQSRTFRCYGYYRSKPQVWSHPSDVLELLVSGPPGVSSPPTQGPISTAEENPASDLRRHPTSDPAGVLPKPSIRAEPGAVIPRGQPVTIVCCSQVWAELLFHLEDENRSVHGDQTVTPPHVSNGTEARFPIRAVSEDTARSYHCRYRKGPSWSEPSEILELKVAAPASQNYTVGNYVRIGLAGVVLLILVVILAEAGHSWHRRPHGPQDQRQGS